MDDLEWRIVRATAAIMQALECYPEMTWGDAVAVNRRTGWSREVWTRNGELDDVSLRRAWDLAMGMRDDGSGVSRWMET